MAQPVPADLLRDRIAALAPWFHNLHLPDGTQTAPDHPLGDFPACKWRQIEAHLPPDLSDWTALDIGCNAGFYSLELARRGARVTALDVEEHYLRQGRWAARECGLDARIAFQHRQVYSLARAPERFDLVLFMGVFYHLRYPLLALDTVYHLQPRLVVFQTLTTGELAVSPSSGNDVDFTTRHRLAEPGWPKMSFVENTFWNDPTNWWVPNHAGVLAMLRSAGFAVVAIPGEEMYICEPSREKPVPSAVVAEWRAAAGS